MKINIMTWNTRLYMMGNKVGNNIEKIDFEKSEKIFIYIKNYLEQNENSIAILQEIPYLSNVKPKWELHEIFKMFCKIFEGYKILYNKGNQIKMTVVITKSKDLIYEDCTNKVNNNRFVAFNLCGTNFSILGVHSHDAFDLREALKNNIYVYFPNLILGDFNAGNYRKKDINADKQISVNRQNYLLLTEFYIDLIQGEYTTNYSNCEQTQIDHILLENGIENCCYGNIKIDRKMTLSDHFPISFELEIVI